PRDGVPGRPGASAPYANPWAAPSSAAHQGPPPPPAGSPPTKAAPSGGYPGPRPPVPPVDGAERWEHLGGSPLRGPDYLLGRRRDAPGAPPGSMSSASGGRSSRSLLLLALVIALLGGLAGGLVGVGFERGRYQSTAAGDLPPGPLLSSGAPTPVDPNPSSVSSIAAKLLPSVVTIGVSGSGESGTGSGVIIRPDGFILTNTHVVAAAASGGTVRVDFYKGQRDVAARIIGRDPKTDLAVIRVDTKNLPAATLGQSKSLVVGAPVVALGAPLGLSSTVTSGIVSALDRNVDVPTDGGDVGGVLIGAIQTDAAINPGNSGGPLVDSKGQVIGVNSAIATAPGGSGSAGNIGVGFAIPIDYARSVAEEIIRTGKATHPYLGVTAGSIERGTGTGAQPGARVRTLVPGGPAERANLEVGDLITSVDGMPIEGVDDLIASTRLHKVGDVVNVTYQRDGRATTVPVTLQEAKG
ncbi:MAG: putative serine protease PepD, partial [Frankiaceae bacterium]|nr:putative serine protease PepD [Frankiaceae bacterium]